MQKLTNRDPSSPSFWDERFGQGFTPWDRGDVPAALKQFVADAAQPLVTLIPGCGSAYELVFLSEAGWDVTAIDFSPAAVAAARTVAGPWCERVIEADFFRFAPPPQLQLIYERAFLCALPRNIWPQVAARWARLLPPGGCLAGFFFFDGALKGPPFGLSEPELDVLLAPYFECVMDAPVADSIALFAGKERWKIWRRTQ